VIADCSCGAVYWAEPPFSSCPRCHEPVLVGAKLETLEEFEARILRNVEARAQMPGTTRGGPERVASGTTTRPHPVETINGVLRLHASSESDGP
jgi:hypothetical protein